MTADFSRGEGFGLDTRRAAQAPPDRSQAAVTVDRVGPVLVHALFTAARTVLMHDLGNRATQRALLDLMAPLGELMDTEGRLSVRVSTDFLVINDVRVIVDPQSFNSFSYLIERMKEREVEEIEFLPGIDAMETAKFLRTFLRDLPEEEPFDTLSNALETAGIEHVRITQWVERERQLRDTSEQVEIREASNRTFFRSVAFMGEVLRGIEQRRAIQVRKAERLTQQMVDIIDADESILLGLASIKDFDEYTFAHSVNVCILSMLIADRLRLYKSDIAHLGVAALLHDIGKTYVPQTILNRPGKLEGRDWDLMKYHTFFGAKELSRVRALREISDALFVSLQHHVHFNMDGYPQKAGGWDLRVFSRIVTVADYYDAMTTPRVYQKKPLTPDEALGFILSKSGQIFDPFVAKVFVLAIGMYPIGTVVELDNGSSAVVLRQNTSSDLLHRPVVKILGSGNVIDTAQRTHDGRRHHHSIVRAFYDKDAEQLKASYFLM